MYMYMYICIYIYIYFSISQLANSKLADLRTLPYNPEKKFSESGLPGGQNLSGPGGSILHYTKASHRPLAVRLLSARPPSAQWDLRAL